MKSFRNFVLGTVLAAGCLAPAAWADADQLLHGQPLRQVSAGAGIDRVIPSLGHAVMAVNAALPRLLSDALVLLRSAPSERQ